MASPAPAFLSFFSIPICRYKYSSANFRGFILALMCYSILTMQRKSFESTFLVKFKESNILVDIKDKYTKKVALVN